VLGGTFQKWCLTEFVGDRNPGFWGFSKLGENN
jgi:hypothetical protein